MHAACERFNVERLRVVAVYPVAHAPQPRQVTQALLGGRLRVRHVTIVPRPNGHAEVVEIVLVRHGETEWTITGQHTSRTDVALTPTGRAQAEAIGEVLRGRTFELVLCSPRSRARATCELAGYGALAEVSDDVAEWDYGDYEGRTTADIRSRVPDWTLWDDGVPNGETAASVAQRADRVIQRACAAAGDVVVFSHGHFLRVLAARWLGLNPAAGRFFTLAAGSLSSLGWEREQAVITEWNTQP